MIAHALAVRPDAPAGTGAAPPVSIVSLIESFPSLFFRRVRKIIVFPFPSRSPLSSPPVIPSEARDLLSPLRVARPLGTDSARDLLRPLRVVASARSSSSRGTASALHCAQ